MVEKLSGHLINVESNCFSSSGEFSMQENDNTLPLMCQGEYKLNGILPVKMVSFFGIDEILF